MSCLFAAFEICHRSHSPLCSLFQIPKPTKIQVKIGQLILSPLLIVLSSSVFGIDICFGSVREQRVDFRFIGGGNDVDVP